MKLKHKISLLVIGLLLVVSILISSSYALWVFNVSQESTNVLVSDCFEITFTEGNDSINLTNSFPMKDGKGVQTTPYEFTLTNICEHAADISINLETLNDSQIAGENLRVDVNGHIHTYGDNNNIEPTLDSASSAALFYNDTIASGKSKSYNLRLWIKEDASSNDIINKTLKSKITVSSTLRKDYSESILETGSSFNKSIKRRAGNSGATCYTADSLITSIERSDIKPTEDNNAFDVSVEGSDNPIYAWVDNGVVYLYTESDKILLNPNSACLFNGLSSIESLDLSYFDTSNVTNMSDMFDGMTNLTNLDLTNIDSSNVTNMKEIFNGLSNLASIDVSNLNTSKVTNMLGMFSNMTKLTDLDVSNIDTSNVTTMWNMFKGLSGLTTLDLSSFNTSNVVSMYSMFSGMTNLTNLNITSFDTSKVTDMGNLFANDSSLTALDLGNFDTSKVTYFSSMFAGMTNLTSLDLSNLNTSSATSMNNMFAKTSNLTGLDLSNFNTSKVTEMGGMFSSMSAITKLDLSNFDTSKVSNMSSMFSGVSNIQELDLSSFNTSSVTNMSYMFNKTHNLEKLDISNFDTSNVTDMTTMFMNSGISTLDLSSFNTKKVTGIANMLSNCPNLKTIYVGNEWSTESVTVSSYMFYNDPNLTGSNGTKYSYPHIDAEYARVDDPQNGKPGYFTLRTHIDPR